MIVEDEMIVSKNLELRLIEEGFNVIASANSGEDAIKLCNSITPDLILMDIKLSGKLDGVQTAAIIKEQKDIPIIYLTAFTDDEILEKAKLTDPFGYLLKPFNFRDLKKTIEIALYKHNLEFKLRQSEEKFRILFNHSPLGNVLFDMNGKIVDANPVFSKMLGFRKEEIIDKDVWKFFVQTEKLNKNNIEQNGNIFETKISNKTGDSIWVRVSYSYIYLPYQPVKYYLAVVEDITIKKLSEEVLKESETRLRRMVENLPAGAVYIDDKSFYFNKEVEKITGYAFSEINNLDEWFLKLYPDQPEIIKNYYKSDKTDGFKTPRIAEITRKDKTKRHVEFIAHLFTSDEVWILIDITNKVKAEEEILRSRDQLKKFSEHLQTAREEERANIAREVHDDLGQALTALKMDLVWLQKNKEATGNVVTSKLIEMVEIINHTIKTIQRIGTELRPKLLDDLGLISALEWQTGEFQKRSGIKCNFNPMSDELNIDPKVGLTVFRIFQEALTNIARHSYADIVDININHSNGTLYLSVADNGKGIPFTKLESSSSIGLIGMKERAAIVGGEIEFNTANNKGTEVLLSIPFKPDTGKK